MFAAFKMVRDLGGEFNGVDEFGRTRLVTAVIDGEFEIAKVSR